MWQVCKREYDEAVSSLAVAKTADERRELTSAVEFYKNNVNGLQQEIEQHKCTPLCHFISYIVAIPV